jgi:hypothetical protein
LRNAFDQVFLYRSNSRYTYHEVIHAYEAWMTSEEDGSE